MATYLSIAMDDGTKVVFQNSEASLVDQRSRPIAEAVDPQLARLETLAEGAAALCTSLRERITPDEISLELGAGLSGEVGWFIVRSSMEASIKITVTWKNPDASNGPKVTER